MKRFTIDVEDDFEATTDEIMDMLIAGQVGLIYCVSEETGLPDPDDGFFDRSPEPVGPVPVKAGDAFPWIEGTTRTILAVLPYTGKYTGYFNVVLRISSPHTLSGHIELAFHDPALPVKVAA